MQMQLRPQQLQHQIKHKQFEINTKKINILIEWTSHLFTSYHRCVICFIAERSFVDLPLPITEVEKFKNGANLLKDLQDGLLVSLVHREKKAIQVKINQDFFVLLPVLFDKTRSKLGLELNNKIMNGTEELKICKVCGIIRSQTEIQFIGETCKCEVASFVPFEKDQKRLKKLSVIGGMIDRVLKEHQGIMRIEEDIAHFNRVMKKLKNRRETEYERFVKMHQLVQAPAELRNSQKTQRRARIEFGRFAKLQEMKRLRTYRRQQFLSNHPQSSHRKQFWVEKKPNVSVARVKKISIPEKQPDWKEEYEEEKRRRRPFVCQIPAEQEQSIKKANLLQDALTAQEIKGSAKQYQRIFNRKKGRTRYQEYFQQSQQSQQITRPEQSSDH